MNSMNRASAIFTIKSNLGLKSMRCFVVYVFFVLVGVHQIVADLKDTSGNIFFKPSSNDTVGMILSTTGLSVGPTRGSANLYVDGNAIITTSLTVGTSAPGSSNLNIYGTMGYGLATVSSNITLSGNSMLLADTSATGGNIVLNLPEASSLPGRIYGIKKISNSHTVTILSDVGIDDQIGYDLYSSSNVLPYLEVISSGNQWYIINGSSFRAPPTAGGNLISWWKLDETSGTIASDSSGYGNHGTPVAFTISGCAMLGKKGNALSFDGVNDRINCGTLGATLTSNFTVMAWINQRSGVWGSILGCSTTNSNNGWIFGIDSGTITFTARGSYDILSPFAFSINQWYHVAVVFGSNNDVSFYVNGNFLQTQTKWAMMPNTDDYLIIGAYLSAAGCFNGLIDDARIYNKVLTANEISRIYRQGN